MFVTNVTCTICKYISNSVGYNLWERKDTNKIRICQMKRFQPIASESSWMLWVVGRALCKKCIHWRLKCLVWVIFGWKSGLSSKYCPFLDIQETLTDFHKNEALFFFLKKKVQNGKTEFFKIANSQNLFVKISWVSRMDWCEGHCWSLTYMVMRLSYVRAKTA